MWVKRWYTNQNITAEHWLSLEPTYLWNITNSSSSQKQRNTRDYFAPKHQNETSHQLCVIVKRSAKKRGDSVRDHFIDKLLEKTHTVESKNSHSTFLWHNTSWETLSIHIFLQESSSVKPSSFIVFFDSAYRTRGRWTSLLILHL
jgi:hypothetical protein